MLLCATCRPQDSLPVFIAGKSYRNSWLDLEKENLPRLDRSQIEKELDRQLADPVLRRLKDQPHEHDLLLDAIHEQRYPYARLDFLVKKLNNQGQEEQAIKFKKRLEKWLKEWKKQEKRGIDKQGHRLKERIKGFVIAFLFVGAAFFYELTEPDWSSYFVQAERLTIDYLKKEDTLKLIGLVHLDYPPDAPEEIFRLTQGHPALAQKICREMVAIANTNNRKTLTMTDLQNVLAHHIYVADNPVCVTFWKQFCHDPAMRETVKQVIKHKQPGDAKQLFRLKQHGFVIEEKDSYRMRVPIFTEWVTRFGDMID